MKSQFLLTRSPKPFRRRRWSLDEAILTHDLSPVEQQFFTLPLPFHNAFFRRVSSLDGHIFLFSANNKTSVFCVYGLHVFCMVRM